MRKVHFDLGEAEKHLGQFFVRIECECGGEEKLTLAKGEAESPFSLCRCGRIWELTANPNGGLVLSETLHL